MYTSMWANRAAPDETGKQMTYVPYTRKIERPGSSAISAVYYDDGTSRLYIEFVKQGLAGSIAGYDYVPVEIFNKFAQAESVGKFYNRVFLNDYNFFGYDMPPNPEMTSREDMPVTITSDVDAEWSGGGGGTVYQVSAVVNVYGADSPGQALDMVLRELENYSVIRSEVSER